MKLADVYSLDINDDTIVIDVKADGDDTGETLTIYGKLSQEYIDAMARFRSRATRLQMAGTPIVKDSPIDGEKEFTKDYRKLQAYMLAELIQSWTFEDELSVEAAAKWMLCNIGVPDQLEMAQAKAAAADDEQKKSSSNTPEQTLS